MLNERRVDELKILYNLLRRSEPSSLKHKIDIMQLYIVSKAKKIAEN